METIEQTNSNSIFNFNEDKWNQMSCDLSITLFSDVTDSGEDDLGVLQRNDNPSDFKEKRYIAMRLTNSDAEIHHLIYLGASSRDPSTWTIEKDITSMQSGAYVFFGKYKNECLLTSCLKTAIFLRFKLDMSVVCSLSTKNTANVVENIQRLARAKGNMSPVLFVLCEDTISAERMHEAVIELEPQSSDLITLASNRPKFLKKQIASILDEFKNTDRYAILENKIEALNQHSLQNHVTGGEKLFKDIKKIVRTHIEMRESELILMVLYILFTYVFRTSALIPILYITSPEAGAGKTIALSILKLLCAHPKDSSDITAAMLADYASTFETVIIDEFDKQEDKPGLVGLINIGYRPAVADYSRCGPGRKTIVKNVASARVIAGIGYPKATTIRERSIFVNLQVCSNSTKFPDVEQSSLGLLLLNNECKKWAVLAKDKFPMQSMDEGQLPNMKRRFVDNYSCLLKVAKCLGDEVFKLAVDACKQNAIDEKPEDSVTLELVIDILKIITKLDRSNIFGTQLAEKLIAMPGRPWKAKSTQLDSFSLYVGAVLKSYRIITGTVRVEKLTAKGYKKRQFNDLLAKFENELSTSALVIND